MFSISATRRSLIDALTFILGKGAEVFCFFVEIVSCFTSSCLVFSVRVSSISEFVVSLLESFLTLDGSNIAVKKSDTAFINSTSLKTSKFSALKITIQRKRAGFENYKQYALLT